MCCICHWGFHHFVIEADLYEVEFDWSESIIKKLKSNYTQTMKDPTESEEPVEPVIEDLELKSRPIPCSMYLMLNGLRRMKLAEFYKPFLTKTLIFRRIMIDRDSDPAEFDWLGKPSIENLKCESLQTNQNSQRMRKKTESKFHKSYEETSYEDRNLKSVNDGFTSLQEAECNSNLTEFGWFGKPSIEELKLKSIQKIKSMFINIQFISKRMVMYDVSGVIKPMNVLCSSSSLVILYLSLFVPFGFCDDHTLRYCHTGLYYPEEGQYRFETIGYVNDQEIDKYSSKSNEDIPMAYWMEMNEDNAYWARQTSLRRGWQKVFRDNLIILASRFNYTRRSYTLQLLYGCTLRDDGSSTGCYQYGFDGQDFLTLDMDTLLWIPSMQKAEISAQRWNSDKIISEGVQLYLTEHCTGALKKYIGYGREELEKRVTPEVKVSSQKLDGAIKLNCLVYGFYPRPVDVKWVRNGVDQVLSDEMSPILPHPDGTYQIRVSVEVPTKEGDSYACHVEHSSLGDETLSVIWEPEETAKMSIIVGTVTSLVVVSLIIFIVVFRARKKEQGSGAI